MGHLWRHSIYHIAFLGFLTACHDTTEKKISPLGIVETDHEEAVYDLDKIQETGELIAVTLSGPDTYYEYRGKGFGLQFELAENFACSIGAKLRMEAVKDTMELFRRLEEGEADLIALEIPERDSIDRMMAFSGAWSVSSDTLQPEKSRWVIRKNATLLSEALDKWYTTELRNTLMAKEKQRTAVETSIRRKMRAPIQNRAKGIISAYDSHFIRHSQAIGWDWRLMAAQCYQESGFDPQAVSWTGAKGLMQIMPETAAHLGLPMDRIYEPEQNISAAARYLLKLDRTFRDVPGRMERISFVLAAYNGGTGHVRDAMALAQKYHKNPYKWDDVSYFILQLSQPKFYNDPVVRFGYLRGGETAGYVKSIHERWQHYRGAIPGSGGGYIPSPSKKNLHNGYKSKVLSAEELENRSKNEQE